MCGRRAAEGLHRPRSSPPPPGGRPPRGSTHVNPSPSNDLPQSSNTKTGQLHLEGLFRRYVREGDVAALGELFDRAAPELFVVAAHLTRDVEGAEDLVQQTFLAAIEGARRFDASRRVMPWLVGILTRQARYLARREGRVVRPERLGRLGGEDPEPGESTERAELMDALAAAMREVPETYREVLTRHLAGGERPREIAGALGRAPGTVRVQLHRGLELLRRALPPSFALGAAAVALPARGLAAVRAEVLAAGEAAWAGGRLGGAVVGVRAALAGAALALAVCGAWAAWRWAAASPLASSIAEITPLGAEDGARPLQRGGGAGPVLARPPAQNGAGGGEPDVAQDARSPAEPREAERQPPAGGGRRFPRMRWILAGQLLHVDPADAGRATVQVLHGREVVAEGTVERDATFELDVSDATQGFAAEVELQVRVDHPSFAVARLAVEATDFVPQGLDEEGPRALAWIDVPAEPPCALLTGRLAPSPAPRVAALFEWDARKGEPVPGVVDEAPVEGDELRLRVAEPGHYVVLVVGPGRLPAWQRVDVGAGEPLLALEPMHLGEGRALSGDVRLPLDRPATGLTVRAVPVDVLDPHALSFGRITALREPLWRGVTWAAGTFLPAATQAIAGDDDRFRLTPLAHTDYVIEVPDAPGLGTSDRRGVTFVSRGDSSATVVPEVSQLALEVRSGGEALGGAKVVLVHVASGERRAVTSGEDGLATFVVPASRTFQLQVTAPDHAPSLRPITSPRAGSHARSWCTLERVEPGRATLALDVSSSGPLPDRLVVEWKPRTQLLAVTDTLRRDTDGLFRLDRLPSGPIEVRVNPGGAARRLGETTCVVTLPVEGEVRHAVELEHGGRLRLAFPATGQGRATCRRLGNVPVPLRSPLSRSPSGAAWVDARGLVESTELLPPGTHALAVVDGEGTRMWSGEARITTGETTTVEVRWTWTGGKRSPEELLAQLEALAEGR